jgi:putative component of membrane protein insertase Oxa1/YidC/SpoIIIJ protein YidD
MPRLLNKNSWLLGLCLLALFCRSQVTPTSDQELLANSDFSKQAFEKKRKVVYLFEGKNVFVKYNPVSLVFGGLLFFYQKTISTQIGAACPYEINCSNFSRTCIRKYGLLKGIPLTADRLTRCTRLAMIGMVDGVDYSSKKMKIYDSPDDYSFKTK